MHPAHAVLEACTKRYPHAWRDLERFRSQRRELGDWPAYVYCPMAGAYAVVSGGGDATVPEERAGDIPLVAALGAWRANPHIAQVTSWPAPSHDLPLERLRKLPRWCTYMELPQQSDWCGVFVHLEAEPDGGPEELRLLLVGHDLGTLALPLPLVGTVSDAVQALKLSARAQMVLGGSSDLEARARLQGLERVVDVAERLVGVVVGLVKATHGRPR